MMDDFPVWSEVGMEYEFEKQINEELEMLDEVRDYVDPTYEEVKEL